MGVFHCTVTVSPVTGSNSRVTEAIVDTGASYSVIPGQLLNVSLASSPSARTSSCWPTAHAMRKSSARPV